MPRRNRPPAVLGGVIPVCLGGLARQTKGTVLRLGTIDHLGFWEGRSPQTGNFCLGGEHDRQKVPFYAKARLATWAFGRGDPRLSRRRARQTKGTVLRQGQIGHLGFWEGRSPQTGNFCLGGEHDRQKVPFYAKARLATWAFGRGDPRKQVTFVWEHDASSVSLARFAVPGEL